jgi:hypothetical protein
MYSNRLINSYLLYKANKSRKKCSATMQWTNKKSKARKNKLIVANQVLLKDNYVSNVIKQKVLRKYLKNAKMC